MSSGWIVGQGCLMKRSHKKEGYLWTSIAQQFCRMPPNCFPFTGRHSKWAEDPLSFPRVDDLSFPSSILWSLVQRAQLRANYRPEHVRDSGSLNDTLLDWCVQKWHKNKIISPQKPTNTHATYRPKFSWPPPASPWRLWKRHQSICPHGVLQASSWISYHLFMAKCGSP